MTTAQQDLEQLGARLRELREHAKLTGRELARRVNWSNSKVSRLENGANIPTENDIRAWCLATDAHLSVAGLLATVQRINTSYTEWRRRSSQSLQNNLAEREATAKKIRVYDNQLVPGLVQTRAYATTVLDRCIAFVGGFDDLNSAVQARLDRQARLQAGSQQLELVVYEDALYTRGFDLPTVLEQLEFLLTAMDEPRITLGIIAQPAEFQCPTMPFTLLDADEVHLETPTAAITVTQPGEIALYEKTFQRLSDAAVTDSDARKLIQRALDRVIDPQRR
ncbi:helix-turn-helix domain-containing protein [Nocardia sp. NPDC058666]|uniref:helix-turn-helix domain-containing protein n=1 Tax=unclassified Nocardia TaxID=2637762 RepID=UPI00366931AC